MGAGALLVYTLVYNSQPPASLNAASGFCGVNPNLSGSKGVVRSEESGLFLLRES